MHSSLGAAAAAAAGGGHSSNNGAAAAAGAPTDGASGPAYESVYNEPEDPTGTRQTLIQVCVYVVCVHGLRKIRHINTVDRRPKSSRQWVLCWCSVLSVRSMCLAAANDVNLRNRERLTRR